MTDQEYIIRLRADQASAAQAENVISRIETKLKGVFKVDVSRFKRDVQSNTSSLLELEKAYSKVAASKEKAAKAGGGSSSSGGDRILGVGARALGAVSPGGADVLRSAQDIKEFGSSLSDVGKLAVGAGVGVGVASAALVLLAQNARATAEAARGELDARQRAIALITSGSQQDIQARIKTLQEQQKTNQAIADDSNKFLADFRQGIRDTYGEIGLGISEVNSTLGTGAGELTAAKDAANAANKALGDTSTELNLLQQYAATGAQSTADLAAAEKELSAIRDKEAEQRISREVQNAQLLRSATEDQVQSRIDSLQDENAAIVKVIDENYKKAESERLSADEIGRLTERLNQNNASLQDLQTNVINVVRARDKEIDSAKKQAAALEDTQKVNEQITQAIGKRQDEIKAINDKYADSVEKLGDAYEEANLEAQQNKLADDLQKERERRDEDFKAKQDLEYALQQADQEAARAEIDARRQRNKTLSDIDRQFNLSATSAQQDRNAVALDAAERQRDSDKAAAEDQYKDEVEQAKTNAKRRQTDLQNDFNQQARLTAIARQNENRERQIAFQNEANQRANKYRNDLAQAYNAQQQELAANKAAFAKQLNDLSTYLGQRLRTEQGYFGTVLAYVTDVRNRINSLLGASGTPSGGGLNTSPGRITPTEFSEGISGGGRGSSLLLGRSPGSGGAGGISVAVNGVGLNKAGVRREVDRQLDHFLTAAGVS